MSTALFDLGDSDCLDSVPPAQPAHIVPVVVVPALASDPSPSDLLEKLVLGVSKEVGPKMSTADAGPTVAESNRSSFSSVNAQRQRGSDKPPVSWSFLETRTMIEVCGQC